MKEQFVAARAKVMTWNRWVLGLIDSVIIGGITAGTGTAGLSIQNAANLEWETFWILFGTGALGGVMKYLMQNPLASIGAAKAIAFVFVCGSLMGCSTMHKALTITQDIQGSGNLTVESPLQMTSVVVENARQEGNDFAADKLDIVHRGKYSATKINLHIENYKRPILIRPKKKDK